MEEGFLCLFIGEGDIQAFCHRCSNTLHGVEAFLCAEDTNTESILFFRIFCQRQALWNKPLGYFKQPSCKDTVLLISGNSIDHGRYQCGPHQGKILVDRIQKPDRISFLSIRSKAKQIQIRRGEERIVHTFVNAHGTERLL